MKNILHEEGIRFWSRRPSPPRRRLIRSALHAAAWAIDAWTTSLATVKITKTVHAIIDIAIGTDNALTIECFHVSCSVGRGWGGIQPVWFERSLPTIVSVAFIIMHHLGSMSEVSELREVGVREGRDDWQRWQCGQCLMGLRGRNDCKRRMGSHLEIKWK